MAVDPHHRITLKLERPPDWMDRAACKDASPEYWFPRERWRTADVALAICRRCPVASECWIYAMDAIAGGNRLHGIWSGRSVAGMTREQALAELERLRSK